jgi:hypothetical protein
MAVSNSSIKCAFGYVSYGDAVRFSRRTVLVTIILASVSIYLSIYTFEAYSIASRYLPSDSNGAVWINGPSGSLFPWPRGPGMAEVLSRINDVDLFIYTYLIKTWTLAGLSTLAWVITVLFVYKAVKHDNV